MVSLGKICLGSALLLLGLVCSHAVTPSSGGGGGGGVSTLHSCSTSASCPKNSKGDAQVCDLLYPGSDGNGTCRTSCDPVNPSCSNNEVCNPITAACEPKCGSDAACATSVASGGTAKCTTGGFCVSVPNGSICPQNFKAAGAFCKLSDSVSNVQNLTLDPITNTWELGCATSGNQCVNLTGLNLPVSATQTLTLAYACSPVTATCVSLCTTTSQAPQGGPLPVNTSCQGNTRSVCYVPGNPVSGSGTCEMGCPQVSCPTSGTGRFANGFQCAEGICQQKCSVVGDSVCSLNSGVNNNNTCDMISQVCREGCSSATAQCKTSNTACSIYSATCVPSCVAQSGNQCADAVRNSCQSEGGASNVCEIGCTGSCTSVGSVALNCSKNSVCGVACSEQSTSNCLSNQSNCQSKQNNVCWF